MKNKVLFITLNITSNRTPEENLGIYYLQKALESRGIETEFIDCWLEGINHFDLIKKIDVTDFLFLGITGCLSNVEEIKKLITVIKDCPVICGGYGATFASDELLEIGVDIVIIGEGDISIQQVAEYYLGNRDITKISGIVTKVNGRILKNSKVVCLDLKDLPCLNNRKYLNYILQSKSTVNLLSSKGCLGSCVFCSINKFYQYSGEKWRGREIQNIIDEIKYLYKQGVRVFKFVDDSFIEQERDKEWIEKFTTKIKESMPDILFRISIRADKVDEEIIELLKKAGLFAVSCGIESGSDNALRRMGKHSNTTINQKALDIFNKYEIYVQAGFIMFDDKTTLLELKESLSFLKNNMQIVMKGVFTEMYAAEGTPFAERLLKENFKRKKIFGNYQYEIQDESARQVYKYLKRWHQMLAEYYDKLIDPISAPKALQKNEYEAFYNLYQSVHNMDIIYLEEVIKNIELGLPPFWLEEMLKQRAAALQNEREELDALYDKFNMNYNAGYNIFLY